MKGKRPQQAKDKTSYDIKTKEHVNKDWQTRHIFNLHFIVYTDTWCFVLKDFIKQSDVFFVFVDKPSYLYAAFYMQNNGEDVIEKDVKKKKEWIPDWRHILTLNITLLHQLKNIHVRKIVTVMAIGMQVKNVLFKGL